MATVPAAVPSDRVNLRLLLVSGSSHCFLFSPDDCAQEITDFVYNNWPEDWSQAERPASNILRLIYQGRFLHRSVTLAALRLPPGGTTVMHLVARDSAPEPRADDERRRAKGGICCCCCNGCCCVL
ncbi:hypothetical protein BOX15_Mlig015799g1 [Macrostomum lignano]|uniref:Ubiquitin-like domain-containing protein n=1 Tax=Macrostomum lignano TaxID=282301 RepID=A0A267ERX9_9PLAT|nr:hypothetical protein BOX15_Mlig024264g1 [Macrostomum lignano]PAA64206.1 hypothetical protein BOX15_Mlig011573g1 [Macrostomum lignano]PAA66123.1 hypothetical protein BOX15_Mlig015799g1 [Macrostomum lignano]